MGALYDSIQQSLSPNFLSGVAAAAGESVENTRKGLETAAATMLAALAARVPDSGFLEQVISLVKGYGSPRGGAAGAAGNAATQATRETRASFLALLFGNNQSAVEDKISQAAGIDSGAGSTIMGNAAPLVLSALVNKVSGGVSGLSQALSSELPGIRSLIPAGLPGIHLPASHSPETLPHTARPQRTAHERGGWLWPVLLLGALLIGALVWYFNRETAAARPAESAPMAAKDAASNATAALSDATRTAWAKLGDLFKRKLPGGTELSIPRFGIENKLVDWIESAKPVDDKTWFDFDRLLFDTGSATLEPASQEQLSNVAAILKAYPKVRIKLGGYTDNTGDAAANLQLSDARAKNVMKELVKLGVDRARLEAQGYGAEHPAADNNTEEGRQRNRRISLRVTQK